MGGQRSGGNAPIVPLDGREFFLGDCVVPLEDRHRFVAGHRHDFEEIVTGEAKVVNGTTPEVVEAKVLDASLPAACREGMPKFLEGFPVLQKHPVRVQPAREGFDPWSSCATGAPNRAITPSPVN